MTRRRKEKANMCCKKLYSGDEQNQHIATTALIGSGKNFDCS